MTELEPADVADGMVPAPTAQGLSPAERALVGHVVEDWVGTYFGSPMAMTREDAVRYAVEGHLTDLVAVRGYDLVRDAVQEYLTSFPDALHTRLTSEQRAVRARTRTEHAEAEGRAASEAFTQGRYDDALRRVDAAELLDPNGRDYDAVRERIRSAADATAAPQVDTSQSAVDLDPGMAPSVAVGELAARLEEAARALKSLRIDLDATRHVLDAAAHAPLARAGSTSVAAAALDLIDAAMEAAARRLAPAVTGWEQVDLGWRTLSAAFSKVLAGDATPIASWKGLSVADVERTVRAALEQALVVLERAVTGVAACVERAHRATTATPAESQAGIQTGIGAAPLAVIDFSDIRADFARLRAALDVPAVERERPTAEPAPDSPDRQRPSTTTRAVFAPTASPLDQRPVPPAAPPAAPPLLRVARPSVRR